MDANAKIWYLWDGEKQTGPFSTIAMKKSIALGKLTADRFVFREGFEDWMALGETELVRSQNSTSKLARDAQEVPSLNKASSDSVGRSRRWTKVAAMICLLILFVVGFLAMWGVLKYPYVKYDSDLDLTDYNVGTRLHTVLGKTTAPVVGQEYLRCGSLPKIDDPKSQLPQLKGNDSIFMVKRVVPGYGVEVEQVTSFLQHFFVETEQEYNVGDQLNDGIYIYRGEADICETGWLTK